MMVNVSIVQYCPVNMLIYLQILTFKINSSVVSQVLITSSFYVFVGETPPNLVSHFEHENFKHLKLVRLPNNMAEESDFQNVL